MINWHRELIIRRARKTLLNCFPNNYLLFIVIPSSMLAHRGFYYCFQCVEITSHDMKSTKLIQDPVCCIAFIFKLKNRPKQLATPIKGLTAAQYQPGSRTSESPVY